MRFSKANFKTPLFIVCILLAALTSFGWLYFSIIEPVGFTNLYLVILYLVTALLSYYFSWIIFSSSTNFKERVVLTSIISLFAAPVIMYLLSFAFLNTVFAVERSKFEKEHLNEIEGNSSFYSIQQFAKKYYNAPLVLGGYEESWALTTLNIPQASPASLRSGTGYCTVNMSKSNLQYMYSRSSNKIKYEDWEIMVLAHELSHCLDRAADLPVGLGEKIKGVSSLAPSVRKDVKFDDIQTYLKAEEQPETQLWREAYADVFAIGYMSLVKNGNISDLRDSLIKYRNGRKEDVTHYTACWLEYSKTVANPKTGFELNAWANFIRVKAPCDLKIENKDFE